MPNTLPQDITTQDLMSLDYRFNYTDEELVADYLRLCETNVYKTGSQFKPGMKLCQHFFPNFFQIQNSKGNSFEKAWQDPIIMDKVREWGLKGMSKLWLSWVRRAVYMAAGLPNSSFYRPHLARQAIALKGSGRILFDPCAGWGGRLLGTISQGWKYIACEPNPETFENLQRMISFLRKHFDIPPIELSEIQAENYEYAEKHDIVLTSPPYFDLEVYTKDDQQSYNKFGTYESWMENWLEPLVNNSLDNLQTGGMSCWNVMNFKGHNIVDEIEGMHLNKGYKLHDTLGFKSPLANIRNLKNKDVTYLFSQD